MMPPTSDEAVDLILSTLSRAYYDKLISEEALQCVLGTDKLWENVGGRRPKFRARASRGLAPA